MMAGNQNMMRNNRYYELVARGVPKSYEEPKILKILKVDYPDITSIHRIRNFREDLIYTDPYIQ